MNKKADDRLKKVTKIFEDTIQESCKITEEQFLCKTITLQNCRPVEKIKLMYEVENRFASISYNLILQSVYTRKEHAAYEFELQYGGMVHIKNAVFVCKSGNETQQDERAKEILQILNDPLVVKKITDLNLLQAEIHYSMERKCWRIRIKSMIGSSTWILIPPVMHTIMPKGREIYALLEVMRMLQCAIQ